MTNEHGIYDSAEYKKSRYAYMMECTFEYFVALLVGDAYLASLLTSIGMPDSMVGIVSSVASLLFCFQLLTMVFVQHVKNVKLFATLIQDDCFTWRCILFRSLDLFRRNIRARWLSCVSFWRIAAITSLRR